jgi:hypothetical protein
VVETASLTGAMSSFKAATERLAFLSPRLGRTATIFKCLGGRRGDGLTMSRCRPSLAYLCVINGDSPDCYKETPAPAFCQPAYRGSKVFVGPLVGPDLFEIAPSPA